MDDTRERFLTAIVGRLGAERIVELHLFSPIRQGVMETGVAVVAALPDLEPQVDSGAEEQAERGAAEGQGEVVDAVTSEATTEPSPYLDATPAEPVDLPSVETPAESRYVVFTASYRLTRKGADRGKWSFELAATADAPLATVDTVVRGVMQRSKDLTESERLSGEQLRAILAEPAWRTTR